MQAFEYSNPASLKEATALLAASWGEADVLAGGTDLISLMKDSLHTPKRVVNIKSIHELGGIVRTCLLYTSRAAGNCDLRGGGQCGRQCDRRAGAAQIGRAHV